MDNQPKKIDDTEVLMRVLCAESTAYIPIETYDFSLPRVPSKDEFARRMHESGGPTDEEYQMLRYLAELTYLDLDIVEDAALAFRATKQMQNVVIERMGLRDMLRKLVRLGLADRRFYCDLSECKRQDGSVVPPQGSHEVFCITEHGATLYREKTESTHYVEDNMYEKSAIEIMRRLCTNFTVLSLRRFFKAGESFTFNTERFKTTGRQPVYGRMESDLHKIIYEPVFFIRNKQVQTESELLKHYELRTQFLTKIFEPDEKEQADGKKKIRTLILICENREGFAHACQLYDSLIESVDEVYICTEAWVRYGNRSGMERKYAPFVRVKKTVEEGVVGYSFAYMLPTFLKPNRPTE